MNSALFRNDNGGLELRNYATPDALAVARERDWQEPLAPLVPEVIVSAHPAGGFTHARLVASAGTARIFQGWFPTRRAARAAL